MTIVDGKNDQNTQTEQINTFLQQGVDVLVINPVQTTSAQTIVDTVKPSETPIVFINREPEKAVLDSYAGKCCYVGADARQSGTYQGELILETETQGDINGDGKITYIMCKGDPENIDAQYRTEYSIKALTDADKEVECLYEYLDNWDQTTAQQDVANALAQYGEKIEVVFCNNDAMALGALQSIEQAGRTVGKDIYLVGVDALKEAVQNVVDGKMTGTVLNDDGGPGVPRLPRLLSCLLRARTLRSTTGSTTSRSLPRTQHSTSNSCSTKLTFARYAVSPMAW